MDSVEDDWGAWGTVYLDEHGRTLGSMQYGPAELFRAQPTCRPARRRTTRCS